MPTRSSAEPARSCGQSGAPPGTLPDVQWRRQMEIDPRVRGFKLQFNETDFK